MGLMPTKMEGVSHAMLGDPGRIGGWIQVEVGPSAIFGNPSLLLGVAGIMTQFARQQEVRELRNFLQNIDEKLDDVRRRQRDEVIAKMDRATTVIEEVMMIRVWLAVLARCLQLKDEHEILELDHVLRTAPDSFERHRLGLSQASLEGG